MKRANVSLGSSPYGLGLSVCTLGICWGARKSPVLRWAGLEGPSCLLDVPPKQNNPGGQDWFQKERPHRSRAKGARIAGLTRVHGQFQSAETRSWAVGAASLP